MSARARSPVRPSANGSGPDPADGSKGDATVADSTQVDTPDTEAAGAADVPVLDRDGSTAAVADREIVATAGDRVDGERPDGPPDADQPDGRADVDQAEVDEPDTDPAEDQPDTRQAQYQVDADQADDDAPVAEPLASDDAEQAAEQEPEPAPVATAEPAGTVEQTDDKTPDPIEVANRFAAEAPEPASLFVRPDKATASSAVVPEPVAMELPVLAPVDEVTMPGMASMVPEPDLHLRPAFQQHQYDTVSAFRRDRSVGATVPVPPSWPNAQPAAEPATTREDSTPTYSDAGTASAASVAPARPVPVPPTPSELMTNRGTVTPLSPAPTRPPVETPPAPKPSALTPGTRRTPTPGPTPSRPTQPRRRPRRARLRLSRVDPWSVAKIALLFSIAMAITTLITVSLLWGVLNLMGVFTDVGQTVSEVTGSSNGGGINVETMLSLSRVLKFTTIIVILQAIVLTCLATLAAFLYNASSGLVGGVEITLSEAE